jgi:hypothetical protein
MAGQWRVLDRAIKKGDETSATRAFARIMEFNQEEAIKQLSVTA